MKAKRRKQSTNTSSCKRDNTQLRSVADTTCGGNSPPLEVQTQKKIATFMSNKGYEVRREVKTPVGNIDILVTVSQSAPQVRVSDRREITLIECKRHHDVNSLKSAIGQLRAYATYYPNAKLILCTEDKTPLSNPSKSLLNNNPDIRLVIL